jgi:hypothetical protein
MTSSSEKVSVAAMLHKYDEKVSALGFQLREFLLQQLENITEYPDPSANVIGYGYGPGYKDLICTMIPSKKGIKLGFYKGTELPDPAHLLEGTGKVHKYVAIRSAESIVDAALKNLLAEALIAYQKRVKQ